VTMATSGSIEIPFAAEWSQLRRDRSALRERLHRLESERGRVSATVFERVRADYVQRQEDLDLRAADLADRARKELVSLSDALCRQEAELAPLRGELEEIELRERLGEELDTESRIRGDDLRRRLAPLEEDLSTLTDLRRRVLAIAEGRLSDAFESLAASGSAPAPAPSAGTPAAPTPHAPPARSASAGSGELGRVSLPPIPEPAASRPGNTEPGAGVARLVAIESADGSDFHALAELTIVGRSGECGLRLPVGTVSRRHAELERTPNGWLVRDLQSENGTWVNDQPVSEQLLHPGDRVQFGTVCLIFRVD